MFENKAAKESEIIEQLKAEMDASKNDGTIMTHEQEQRVNQRISSE